MQGDLAPLRIGGPLLGISERINEGDSDEVESDNAVPAQPLFIAGETNKKVNDIVKASV